MKILRSQVCPPRPGQSKKTHFLKDELVLFAENGFDRVEQDAGEALLHEDDGRVLGGDIHLQKLLESFVLLASSNVFRRRLIDVRRNSEHFLKSDQKVVFVVDEKINTAAAACDSLIRT